MFVCGGERQRVVCLQTIRFSPLPTTPATNPYPPPLPRRRTGPTASGSRTASMSTSSSPRRPCPTSAPPAIGLGFTLAGVCSNQAWLGGNQGRDLPKSPKRGRARAQARARAHERWRWRVNGRPFPWHTPLPPLPLPGSPSFSMLPYKPTPPPTPTPWSISPFSPPLFPLPLSPPSSFFPPSLSRPPCLSISLPSPSPCLYLPPSLQPSLPSSLAPTLRLPPFAAGPAGPSPRSCAHAPARA